MVSWWVAALAAVVSTAVGVGLCRTLRSSTPPDVPVPPELLQDDHGRAALSRRRSDRVVEEATDLFASSVEIGDVLDLVTVKLAETFGDACFVRLLDDSGRWLLPATLHHHDPDRREVLLDAFGRIRSRADEGLSGKALAQGGPVLIDQMGPTTMDDIVLPDPGFRMRIEDIGLSSALMVPLVHRGRPIGTLAVCRDLDERQYDDRDVSLLVAVSARAALAIYTAQLVEVKTATETALANLGRRALELRDPYELMQEAMAGLRTSLSARYAFYMRAESPTTLRVVAVSAPEGEESSLPLGSVLTKGVPVDVLAKGEAVICEDMRHDEAKGMVEMGRLLESDSGIAVVVSGRSGRRGVMTVAGFGRSRYTEPDLRVMEAFASMLATALDRMEVESELQEVAEDRRELLDRLVGAQEEERGRIADGVHDDQVPVLAALSLRLGSLREKVAVRDPDLLEPLEHAQGTLHEATARLRDLLFALQPPPPNEAFHDAVREAAAYVFQDVRGTEWGMSVVEPVQLPARLRLVAHRILREALINVRDHAEATHVDIAMRGVRGGVEIEIVDDGRGMATPRTRSPIGHRGLSSMSDRAFAAGGWLRVKSRPGEGTRLTLWLPVD